MLLSPGQRTFRAGGLFAGALALAMVKSGWELEVDPGVFRMRRGDHELDPFDAVNQLMAGKLSPEEWVARCQELGLSRLFLSPHFSEGLQQPPQAELFSLQEPE